MERSDRITGGNPEMEKYIGKYSVKDFLYLILGAFIYSIGTHSFIETANIAPAGRTADTDGQCAAFNTGVVSFEPCLCGADGVCVRNLFGCA